MRYALHRLVTLTSALTLFVSAIAFGPKQAEAQAKTAVVESAGQGVESAQRDKAWHKGPNIVLILLDDVGFGAASTFGGPVSTPELDKLAAQGLRYNRFHVSALCSPTRAALLSGRNDHQVGFGSVTEAAGNLPGYNGIWPKSAASIAEVLRLNGYSTAAFGKWHNTPYKEISPVGPFERWPTGLGFEYFYGFMRGWDDQWEPQALYRNTMPVQPAKTQEEGYHLTTDITDEAINWVRTHAALAPDKPYFLYFAPGATHVPHQVPEDWIAKYKGRFDRGWDVLREETFARQKKLGIIPEGSDLPARPKELPAWDELSSSQKAVSAREMEVYAAFLAHADGEVGRLLQVVQTAPHGDDTLILYIVGDNGADGAQVEPELPKGVIDDRLKHLADLGGERYPGEISAGWALAADTPFPWMKKFASHLGGTRDPLVVSWPGRIRGQGGLRNQYIHVTDVAPTLYEVAHVKLSSDIGGVKQLPLSGVSFGYTFDHPSAPSQHRVQIYEQLGNRSIYKDGWLAGARHMTPWNAPPRSDFDREPWELYNLNTDFTEAHNLANAYPAKVRELQRLFDGEARRNNVYPLHNLFDFAKGTDTSPVKRSSVVFYPGLPRIPAMVAPQFQDSSFTISADVAMSLKGAQGTILFAGGKDGGFALYVNDMRLVFEASDGSTHIAVKSSRPIPSGKSTLRCQFTQDKPSTTDGYLTFLTTGSVRLYVNGVPVSEAAALRIRFDNYTGNFGVGKAYGRDLITGESGPFPFTGALGGVRVDLQHRGMRPSKEAIASEASDY